MDAVSSTIVPLLEKFISIPLFVFDVKLFVPLNERADALVVNAIGHAQKEMPEVVTLVTEAPFNNKPFPVLFERLEFARSKLPPSILMHSLLEFERELP